MNRTTLFCSCQRHTSGRMMPEWQPGNRSIKISVVKMTDIEAHKN